MSRLTAAKKPVLISCMVGAALMGSWQISAAFSNGAESGAASRETCSFTQQLQQSVSIRRQYLVRVAAAVGRPYFAKSAVEEMYGNVRPASYTTDAGPDDQSLPKFFRSAGKAATVGLDAMSADCLGCHDGVGASAVGADLRNAPNTRIPRVNSFTSDHPVGMDYNSYVAAARGFKPILSPGNMIFVNGKVGCLTCHDPLNSERGHLVKSDRNSALCATCHDK